MPSSQHAKVLLIGAGPAGYTAAIYAARANLAPLVLEGPQPGGQLTITTDVENWPGNADPVQGPWLMDQMRQQAARMGATLISDTLVSADFSARPFALTGESGATYTAQAVIVATGAQARWLGLESETRFRGFGVSGCATCDGFFYRGKKVAVVGGGNSAMEEALYLAELASHVTLIHRRDDFRGERVLKDRILAHPKISVMWDSVIEEIVGETQPLGVTGARVRHVKTGQEAQLDVAGIFIAIGHKPATDIFKGQLPMDEEGYLRTRPDSTATDVPGVFAAGDVKDKVFKQAITAAGMGCMAALEVEKYLAHPH